MPKFNDMVEGVDYFRCSKRLPGNDRTVLVFADYFGPVWHPACYVGTGLNEGKDRRRKWVVTGELMTHGELNVKFWMEMPWMPPSKFKYKQLPRI